MIEFGKEIIQYDDRNNCIYYRRYNVESWYEYDKNNNLVHFKNSDNYESWAEYDYTCMLMYSRTSRNEECWNKLLTDERSDKKSITKQEFEQIKEKEFLSREEIPRFKLMEV